MNKRGFSVLEVMVAVTLSSIVLMAAATLSSQMSQTTQKSFQTSELFSIVNLINATLSNDSSCKIAFQGQAISLTQSLPLVMNMPFGVPQPTVAAGTPTPTPSANSVYINGGALPQTIGNVQVNGFGISPAQLVTGTTNAYYVTISFSASIVGSAQTTPSAASQAAIQKNFNFVVQTKPSGSNLLISDCWQLSNPAQNMVCPNPTDVVAQVNPDGTLVCRSPDLSQINVLCSSGQFVSSINTSLIPAAQCTPFNGSCSTPGTCMVGISNGEPQCESFTSSPVPTVIPGMSPSPTLVPTPSLAAPTPTVTPAASCNPTLAINSVYAPQGASSAAYTLQITNGTANGCGTIVCTGGGTLSPNSEGLSVDSFPAHELLPGQNEVFIAGVYSNGYHGVYQVQFQAQCTNFISASQPTTTLNLSPITASGSF